jgi:hypothetical protein
MDKFFFPLRDGYDYGRHLNKFLRDELGNKLVQDAHATGLLAQAVVYAGDGDYIEVGSLHGGSAITVAMVKDEFNLTGDIFCIDPDPRDIYENAEQYDVASRIVVHTGYLEDFLGVAQGKFSCALIDGDHRPPHPLKDFQLLKGRITKYCVFDDYDKSELGVQRAVESVFYMHWLWRAVHISNAIVIFERLK